MTAQQLEGQIWETNKQLAESDRKDLGEEALDMADEAELGLNKRESAAKGGPKKEAGRNGYYSWLSNHFHHCREQVYSAGI